MKNITIVGGGLTGLSLAIALRNREIPVTLHEAGHYPRHRVCGEFISGVSQKTLENLGITEAFHGAAHHQNIIWYSQNTYLREMKLPIPAIGISRYQLDNRLQILAKQRGAHLNSGSRVVSNKTEPGTVWTAGRRPTKGTWVGLKAHIRSAELPQHLAMYSGPHGYLGIAPVEEDWHNVCGLFQIDRSLNASHQDLLPAYLKKNGNTDLAKLLEFSEWRENSFTAIAGFELGKQARVEGHLALGDSHSIIPPFTGNGMSMAFQSAEIALPFLTKFSEGKSSWPETILKTMSALDKKFKKRLAASKLMHPLLFKTQVHSLMKFAPIPALLQLIR